MFLRRCARRKDGKNHSYWALVESYRTVKGSRQRVVAYLGDLRKGQLSGWSHLGRRMAKGERPQPELFDPPHYNEQGEEEWVEVDLKGVRFERVRDFGDVWLAWGLWRMLALDDKLTELMAQGREDVPWPVVAAVLVIGRFCAPSSELWIEDCWYGRTALEDLLGVRPEQIHTNRLYAGLDRLLVHKEAIETHLKRRLGDLFDLDYDLLVYDVTSTYFEGEAQANLMAKRGYSRDHRSDRPQVCIGLVVTTDGMPVGYEVFEGNRNDSTTVESIVEVMERRYGKARRVWVLDRGMVSEDNLRFIRGKGASYIVGTPKPMLRQFEKDLTGMDWKEVEPGVEVKLVAGPDSHERFILARSADRREKEKAIHERCCDRMEDGLRKLQVAAESGRLKESSVAHQRLGRLRERYWRANGAFEVSIRQLDCGRGRQRLEITWVRNRGWEEWALMSQGCYLLRTNLKEMDPAKLWRQYVQLTDAEWAFRIAKDELQIRPIWHQTSERVRGHILVCFLAYCMWKALGGWMKAARLGEAPRTLLDEFAKIKSGDVVLPVRSSDGQCGKTVRLRCVTMPDKAQKVLLNR
ncbi:MAG: IS1634 family transposase, partial [Deltaproteobacteria bacterium]|nr:IS1634 family transposase [Deltaproteobacteria bacterium]